MIILGIDPGTATSGYGLIDVNKNGLEVIKWGLIETCKDNLKEDRLQKIYEDTFKLIKEYKPNVFVFEKIFFFNNAKTVIAVGQAQGVMLLAASNCKTFVAEYAPGTIKKLITGSGRANKKEVQMAVRKILGNKVRSKNHKKTHFDNAADALAIAMTHAMTVNEFNLKLTNFKKDTAKKKIKKIKKK